MEPQLAEVVARAEALAADITLEAVRRWKEAAPGRKAVGYMPVYAPREVLHAAGVLPVAVMGGGDAVEIVRGDAYFQSYICQIPRSTIELGLNGGLDALDGMIFPSTCDVIRNLSGMWQVLFPGRYVRYLDVPQNFGDSLGGAYFVADLRALLRELCALSGREPDDAALWASIELYDRNRALMQELYALRAATPWLVPTTELYQVLRAGNALPVEEHNALLADYIAAARASGRPVEDRARVALTGCFCEQPPLGLLLTLERSGCYVVADDFCRGARFIEGPVAEGGHAGDPLEALARAFLRRGARCQSMYLDRGEKGAALLAEARAASAEGVIFASPSFCDPALLDQPMTLAHVAAAGLPTTSFKYAENTGQFQAIREQTGAFADSIKIWGEAEAAPDPAAPRRLPVLGGGRPS
ncbi:MAG: benzoyl-CoA reductase subunit C [Planctomycetota bacterium]